MATHCSTLSWRIPWRESLAGYSPWGHKSQTQELYIWNENICILKWLFSLFVKITMNLWTPLRVIFVITFSSWKLTISFLFCLLKALYSMIYVQETLVTIFWVVAVKWYNYLKNKPIGAYIFRSRFSLTKFSQGNSALFQPRRRDCSLLFLFFVGLFSFWNFLQDLEHMLRNTFRGSIFFHPFKVLWFLEIAKCTLNGV